ncbi:unnamed protein product [Rotaria magnacalcarata]|uniref:Tudor domain-containing protein n=9 Tax=Rotaria magnacalcarata TaxID=392030 RepID=A0A815VL82_9BILA|nr:unnamed protein product [Rotaria magnacalcarata]CAF1536694.1 unnamed protein product [Rotaria magnacalcarata]CAF1933083.1 unnamed protein product [Rotaria magnacalcarata]
MTHESSATMVIDEINRLSVAYEKAKEYVSKIASSIEQQIDIWQYRRQVILDQVIQMKPSSSYDFLLPKTQRINDLTLDAVQALCRVDLLIEQVLRIDPKSHLLSVSTSQLGTNIPSSHVRHSTPSLIKQQQTFIPAAKVIEQPPLPVPVLRMPQQALSGRVSALITEEKPGFKPITHRLSPNNLENASRPSPIYPYNGNQFLPQKGLQPIRPTLPSYNTVPLQSDHAPSPFVAPPTSQLASNYKMHQQIRAKEKLKLQRIPSGTKWKEAKIDIIDSLSGFYVENLDAKVCEKFSQMQTELHDYYNQLEVNNQLMPLENIAIGDFGVAKYSEDNRWYRARLITCEGHDQIKIVFVDFGNIEIKLIHQFFPLHKLFTDLPAQAIGCSLSEAFPRSQNEHEVIWSEDTIQIFKDEVIDKVVEIHFVNQEEGTEQWPLHFVRIMVDGHSVTSLSSFQQRIDPRPNRFIAEQMAPFLSQQEYILFNVPITEDDFEQ